MEADTFGTYYFLSNNQIEYVCIYMCVYRYTHTHICTHAQFLGRVQLFATPWTVAHQAPLSIGFSQ